MPDPTRHGPAARLDAGAHPGRDGDGAAAAAALPQARAGWRPPTSLLFTERMAGRVAFGVGDCREGQRTGEALSFRLTIVVDDLDRFVADPQHAATPYGSLRCEALGGRLPVERGWFNLFVDVPGGAEKRMRYRLWFRDRAGHDLTLSGHKEVGDAPGFDLWADTTTLFTRLLAGHVDHDHDGDAAVVAAGVLRIRPLDFARQLTTFRALAPTARERLGALVRFGRLFAGELGAVYGPARRRR